MIVALPAAKLVVIDTTDRMRRALLRVFDTITDDYQVVKYPGTPRNILDDYAHEGYRMFCLVQHPLVQKIAEHPPALQLCPVYTDLIKIEELDTEWFQIANEAKKYGIKFGEALASPPPVPGVVTTTNYEINSTAVKEEIVEVPKPSRWERFKKWLFDGDSVEFA